MPQFKEKIYTSEDYWNLPEKERAELIEGKLYMQAAPSARHQEIVHQLSYEIENYIRSRKGDCKVYPAPFAVNLNADDKTFVEPDISVICDRNKLSDRGCEGAPDFVIEVVSPGSRKMDYIKKTALYMDAGVREYWVVDPDKERTTIFRYEEDATPVMLPFHQPVTVGIYENFSITISELLK